MIDIDRQISEHLAVIEAVRPLAPQLEAVARLMSECLSGGGKILWMGNGGSAADSQHLAAEFVGRFSRERRGLASIALTTDTSILTSVGNDYGFDKIFSRQIEALCQPGDIVVGISTSGNSPNVVDALRVAGARQAITVGFGGGDGGAMRGEVEHCLVVPSAVTARVQEAHILMGHILCDWVEASVAHG
jgi:D-sedoheptulose 7-phosphate isomerase